MPIWLRSKNHRDHDAIFQEWHGLTAATHTAQANQPSTHRSNRRLARLSCYQCWGDTSDLWMYEVFISCLKSIIPQAHPWQHQYQDVTNCKDRKQGTTRTRTGSGEELLWDQARLSPGRQREQTQRRHFEGGRGQPAQNLTTPHPSQDKQGTRCAFLLKRATENSISLKRKNANLFF